MNKKYKLKLLLIIVLAVACFLIMACTPYAGLSVGTTFGADGPYVAPSIGFGFPG